MCDIICHWTITLIFPTRPLILHTIIFNMEALHDFCLYISIEQEPLPLYTQLPYSFCVAYCTCVCVYMYVRAYLSVCVHIMCVHACVHASTNLTLSLFLSLRSCMGVA